jgi:hypothetical protein
MHMMAHTLVTNHQQDQPHPLVKSANFLISNKLLRTCVQLVPLVGQIMCKYSKDLGQQQQQQ